MKRLEAIIAATLVTGVVALAMLAIGVSAVLNQNSVPVSNSVADVTNTTFSPTDPQGSAQIDQLKNLVVKYQSREQQYQAQLDRANTQIQQLQDVLDRLQRMGVIRILSDGTIQVRRSGSGG
jgi:peptidoglycan hydrolase CwlO-like protein